MPEKSDIAHLVGSITSDAKRIAGGEIALAKTELKPTWKQGTWDVKVLLAGAVLGLLGGIALTIALGGGLAYLFAVQAGWSPFAAVLAGYGIVGVVFAGLGGPVALVYWRKVKAHLRAAGATVQRVGSDTGQALTALHEGFAQGQELVDSHGRR
jgi:hypothetical protein